MHHNLVTHKYQNRRIDFSKSFGLWGRLMCSRNRFCKRCQLRYTSRFNDSNSEQLVLSGILYVNVILLADPNTNTNRTSMEIKTYRGKKNVIWVTKAAMNANEVDEWENKEEEEGSDSNVIDLPVRLQFSFYFPPIFTVIRQPKNSRLNAWMREIESGRVSVYKLSHYSSLVILQYLDWINVGSTTRYSNLSL